MVLILWRCGEDPDSSMETCKAYTYNTVSGRDKHSRVKEQGVKVGRVIKKEP